MLLIVLLVVDGVTDATENLISIWFLVLSNQKVLKGIYWGVNAMRGIHWSIKGENRKRFFFSRLSLEPPGSAYEQ